MKTVWKYGVPNKGEFSVMMPKGAEVLSVQEQPHLGPAAINMWALVDTEAEKTMRKFFVIGTGHATGTKRLGRSVGTFQLDRGRLIYHLFEEKPLPKRPQLFSPDF